MPVSYTHLDVYKRQVQFYAASYDSANRVKDIGYMVSPAWNGTFRDGRAYGYTYDCLLYTSNFFHLTCTVFDSSAAHLQQLS